MTALTATVTYLSQPAQIFGQPLAIPPVLARVVAVMTGVGTVLAVYASLVILFAPATVQQCVGAIHI